MVIKVRQKELNDVKTKMMNDAEKLNIEIENLLQYLNELKAVWKGIDAELFQDEAYNYIKKMQTIPECLNVMGNFISNANNEYERQDNDFKNELEKETNYYEEDNNNQF